MLDFQIKDMVRTESCVKICDNSGAKIACVIHVTGGTDKRSASIGERVKVSLKSVIPGSSCKKGDVKDAVIVRTVKSVRRLDGTYISFEDNAAVILSEDGVNPVGTRVSGAIPRELAQMGFQKILSLAQEVV